MRIMKAHGLFRHCVGLCRRSPHMSSLSPLFQLLILVVILILARGIMDMREEI